MRQLLHASSCLLTALLLAGAPHGTAHPAAETRIARLNQLISAQPQQQALLIQRGALYARHGQWQLALHDLELAQTLGDPRQAGFELGRLHYQRHDYALASTQFSRFLALHPDSPEAFLYRARAAQAAGNTQAALADFDSHLRLTDKPHPGDILAAAQLLASPTGTEAAIALLDAGMSQLGQQAQLQRYAIELEIQRDNLPGALQRCRQMGSTLGQSPRWQLEMAELLLLAGQREEATVLLGQAQEQLNGLRLTPARQALQDKIERAKKIPDSMDETVAVNTQPRSQ